MGLFSPRVIFAVLFVFGCSGHVRVAIAISQPPHKEDGNLTPTETDGIRDHHREQEPGSIMEDETSVAALKLMKKILDKASEKSSILENNEKEWVHSVL